MEYNISNEDVIVDMQSREEIKYGYDDVPVNFEEEGHGKGDDSFTLDITPILAVLVCSQVRVAAAHGKSFE